MIDSKQRLDRYLGGWIQQSIRFRYWILLLFMAAGAFALVYTLNNLTINTNTRDMLSKELDWRELDLAYESEFPMYVDTVLVVVEADTPDQAADAAQHLKTRLQQASTYYENIYYAAGLEFFRKSALLYMEQDELQDLADQLAAIQPFLGQLVHDQSLRGLFDLIQEAVAARRDGQAIELAPLLERITRVAAATRRGEHKYLSWQALITGETESRQVYREYIVLKPTIDYTSLLPGETAVKAVRSTIEASEISEKYNASARLTGNATLAYEELQSVTWGAEVAAVLALVAVSIILTLGLRSGKMVVATLITLITGLILTAGMATATVGELNLISVAFAVLYIGLGVDFAIHFCLRLREVHAEKQIDQALLQAGTSVSRSLFSCALTTAVGLYAFMPTSYRGIAELGWISGTGMFISLLVTLTLLPALLSILAPAINTAMPVRRANSLSARLVEIPQRHARLICGGAFILTLLALALLPFVHFDPNTINLQANNLESVQTYRDLLEDSDASPMSGIVMVRDIKTAEEMSDRLTKLSPVADVRYILDFIPDNQEEKLAIIDELNLLLGTTLVHSDGSTITANQRRQALDELLNYLEKHPPTNSEHALSQLHEVLIEFRNELENQPHKAADMLVSLEKHLLQNLSGRLRALSEALNAEKIVYEELPESLLKRWVSPGNWYRLEVLPSQSLDNEGNMRKFVDSVRTETSNLIGPPVIQLEAGDSVVTAFIEAFALAFIVITILLVILLRSIRDTILALLPILLAALLTAAGTVILGIPFNFANIIALPLLLGIGIDNSIHILHRHRSVRGDNGPILRSGAARAILVSALTTICSIGNLAFSPHQGTASMGLLLSTGIAMSLLCALVLLPALLSWKRN